MVAGQGREGAGARCENRSSVIAARVSAARERGCMGAGRGGRGVRGGLH